MCHRIRVSRCAGFVALGLCVLHAAAALAVDGITEINAAGVAAAGGFPFKILQSGSYRLTSNLQVPSANTTAIEIQADNVSLDLNGFEIAGPNQCSGSAPALVCSAPGTGVGVLAAENVRIANGTIRGMGNRGISGGNRMRIEKVSVLDNAADGISAGWESDVRDCLVIDNGSSGLRAGPYSHVTGNVVRNNQVEGIVTFQFSVTQQNVSDGNGTFGMVSAAGNNTIIGNTFGSNAGGGIEAAALDLIVNNTLSQNVGPQLSGNSLTAYGGNVVFGTTTVVGGPHQISTNSCNGTSICP